MTRPVPDRSFAERNDDLCDGRTHIDTESILILWRTVPELHRKMDRSTREEVWHSLLNRGCGSLPLRIMFSSLSLSDAENTLLAHDMVFVGPQVVKRPFDQVFDLLCAWSNIGFVARADPETLPLSLHWNFEPLPQIVG